jgi:hypothetical protein
LGRLTGADPANNAIIRLETAFGGGKTHNLIALYHAARGYPPPFVDASLVPAEGAIQIAGVVGSDLDPSNGLNHGDVVTYTLWGEIAYQLRGAEGYSCVRQSDLDKAAPGTAALENLIGDAPALIMIDEVARHLRTAKNIMPAGGGSDLAEQTVAFLMSLLEFVASKQHVVVVFTLADPSDAFGKETEEFTQELAETKRISARQERVITPTAETEIAAIVKRRLFKSIDMAVAAEVASVYASTYHRCVQQGANIPQRALRAEYGQEIEYYYPFHPELLNTLNRKTSTIPNFQRTRGVLRLLAMVIRELWTCRPEGICLIHPHDVNLAVGDIANDLTSRLERPRFKQVIEADIVSTLEGSLAHAQSLDDYYGGTPYTQRVATAAFLHSLTQGIASGVDPADLVLATVTPDDDPALLLKAANQLVENGWFFEYDGHRYRFKTEPSINKIINDEIGMVGIVNSKAELDRRIRQIWKKGYFLPVFFPSEPGDVPDDAEAPKLVVMHYDAAVTAAGSGKPHELVVRIFNYAGLQEGYRRFKNNLIFLVADEDQVENMVEQMRRYLAIQRIINDADRMGEFFPEQRNQLKKKAEAAELDVRVAITKAYRWLYYPSAEVPESQSHLARVQLAPQDQGDVAPDQSTVVLNVLKDLDRVITQESNVLSGKFVREKAWDVGQTSITTEDLRKAFARRMNLRMLLDINQLKKTIRNGIEKGVWVYYDAHEQIGYNAHSPMPAIQISDEAILYTPEQYAELGWPIKGEEVQQLPTTMPPSTMPFDHVPAVGPSVRLRGKGAPAQAFQALRDACVDQGIRRLREVNVEFEGDDHQGALEVRSLGLTIPQLGRGEFWIEQNLAAEFGNGEQIEVNFAGGWDRYKRLKQVTDSFGQEAQKFSAQTRLRMRFPGGLDVYGDQFQTIIEVFSGFEFGHLVVDAEPFEEVQ